MKKVFFVPALAVLLFACGQKQEGDGTPASVVVSADKMNIVYVGVQNPISVSASGVAPKDLVVSTEDGNVQGSDGHYVLTVNGAGEVKINVSAKDKDGNVKPLGPPLMFRAKMIPNPVASFAGKTGVDIISLEELKNTNEVTAVLAGFDFDLKFNVVSFDITMLVKGAEITIPSKSNQVTEKQRELLSKAASGSKIYIENIKAQGPDGGIRKVDALVLTVL